jgi:hypothetical protein
VSDRMPVPPRIRLFWVLTAKENFVKRQGHCIYDIQYSVIFKIHSYFGKASQCPAEARPLALRPVRQSPVRRTLRR